MKSAYRLPKDTLSGFHVQLLKINDPSFSSYDQIRKGSGKKKVDRLTPPCSDHCVALPGLVSSSYFGITTTYYHIFSRSNANFTHIIKHVICLSPESCSQFFCLCWKYLKHSETISPVLHKCLLRCFLKSKPLAFHWKAGTYKKKKEEECRLSWFVRGSPLLFWAARPMDREQWGASWEAVAPECERIVWAQRSRMPQIKLQSR